MLKRFPAGAGVFFLILLYSLPLSAANGLVGTWSAGTLSIGFRAEDGDYKVAIGPQQDTWNGLNRVRMVLKDENGSIKNVIYYLDSFQEDGQPALALSMAVKVPEVAQDYQGLTARLCGDIIVVGYADLFVEDNFIKAGYTENGGVYRVYGNILMMQYTNGEVSTYPVKRSDTALQIGGRVYTR